MKKHLLLSAVLFVCSFQLFSQDTLANMLEVGNKWSRSLQVHQMASYEFVDRIIKDTIINNKKFVICQEETIQHANGGHGGFKNIILTQIGNKVIYSTGKSEFTAYEFSGLNAGDSIICNVDSLKKYMNYTFYDVFPTLKIVKVDTLYFNNLPTRRFELFPGSHSPIKNYFFEGIGFSLAGPLIPLNAENTDIVVGRVLRCFKNKFGTFSYVLNYNNSADSLNLNENSSFCDVLTNTTDLNFSTEITLSQPSENQLQLNTELSLSNAQISIHNMKGSRYNCSIQQNNLVDIATLSAGLYILKLQTADQNLASFKFIKN